MGCHMVSDGVRDVICNGENGCKFRDPVNTAVGKCQVVDVGRFSPNLRFPI